MDFTSPEFYTIAFVVAMALVALLMGRNEKKQPSTYIVQLNTVPEATGDSEMEEEHADVVTLELLPAGRVRITRTGLSLGAEETANLVITIRDDECSVIEKKGIKRRGVVGVPVQGEAVINCLKPMKYHMRYESQITSTWATFNYDAASANAKRVELNY